MKENYSALSTERVTPPPKEYCMSQALTINDQKEKKKCPKSLS